MTHQNRCDIPNGMGLRAELSLRGLNLATENGFLFERTDGAIPGIIFGRAEDGRHGNFHPLSFQRICTDPGWAKRLDKVHTASKRLRFRSTWQWKELDCAHSSDALLMNIFCYPEVLRLAGVCAMLGVDSDAEPEFGFRPRTPLIGEKRDNTEIDLAIGNLLIEAKLTESDFQSAPASLITRYRDLDRVFQYSELPLRHGKHIGYQLVRDTLAACATGRSFCVLCDARRPDLMETWYRVICAVKSFELRCRLKLLTWQELASVLPDDLQRFLEAKYGISAVASRPL